jgi:hypothetical protein
MESPWNGVGAVRWARIPFRGGGSPGSKKDPYFLVSGYDSSSCRLLFTPTEGLFMVAIARSIRQYLPTSTANSNTKYQSNQTGQLWHRRSIQENLWIQHDSINTSKHLPQRMSMRHARDAETNTLKLLVKHSSHFKTIQIPLP